MTEPFKPMKYFVRIFKFFLTKIFKLESQHVLRLISVSEDFYLVHSVLNSTNATFYSLCFIINVNLVFFFVTQKISYYNFNAN